MLNISNGKAKKPPFSSMCPRVSCLVHQVGCIWHTWDVMSGKFGASLFLHKLEMLAWTAPWHTIYASCFDDLWIFRSKSEIEPSDRYQIKWIMTFDLHHAIWLEAIQNVLHLLAITRWLRQRWYLLEMQLLSEYADWSLHLHNIAYFTIFAKEMLNHFLDNNQINRGAYCNDIGIESPYLLVVLGDK